MSIVFAKKRFQCGGSPYWNLFYGVFLFWMFVVFLSVFASVPAGARPALLLEGFQCCGVVGLAGDFVDEVAVDDAAGFVEDEDASGEESCEGSVNEL